MFLALTYAATGRLSLVIIGLALFLAGSALMANLFEHVRDRIDIWLDPFADPLGAGYQIVQSLHAFARGGLLGTGLGNGLPMVGGRLPIPEIHTDFPLAALGEELGLVGVIAILGLYFVVIQRGLRIGASAADDFRAILATGLALIVGRPGLHHRRRQSQGPAADRGHPAVRELRRFVAAGQRRRRRAAPRPVRPWRRAAAAAQRARPAGVAASAAGNA